MESQLEKIKQLKSEKIALLELLEKRKEILTSETNSPIISKISEFLLEAEINPRIPKIKADIESMKIALNQLSHELSRYEMRLSSSNQYLQYYNDEIRNNLEFIKFYQNAN